MVPQDLSQDAEQSYPMQDDPEGDSCFQYSMILKEGCDSFGEPVRFRVLRGNEGQHAGWKRAKSGADPGLAGSE
jgi:hypothetical protein